MVLCNIDQSTWLVSSNWQLSRLHFFQNSQIMLEQPNSQWLEYGEKSCQLDLRQAAQLGGVRRESDYITGEGHRVCFLTSPVMWYTFASRHQMKWHRLSKFSMAKWSSARVWKYKNMTTIMIPLTVYCCWADEEGRLSFSLSLFILIYRSTANLWRKERKEMKGPYPSLRNVVVFIIRDKTRAEGSTQK